MMEKPCAGALVVLAVVGCDKLQKKSDAEVTVAFCCSGGKCGPSCGGVTCQMTCSGNGCS